LLVQSTNSDNHNPRREV